MANVPMEFRWGIISTGKIAECFAKDMLVDPTSRNVYDVVHCIVAVGSRNVTKAEQFIDKICGDKTIKAYGSYEDVYSDPDVDALYIGTPHTYHYTNALAGLRAKKHVLCEKPVTCNAAELQSLFDVATEEGVFFMEALWTRFHPLSLAVKEHLYGPSATLGKPVVVHADLSADFGIENLPLTHRILDPKLGGGALLDLGPYPMIWTAMALFEHPLNRGQPPVSISSTMTKTPITGVDSTTQFTLQFGDGQNFSAQAILSCSMTLDTYAPGVSIRCQRGTITIEPPIYCPKKYSIETYSEGSKGEKMKTVQSFDLSALYVGGGWHWQADEVARCARDGKLQSELWGWDKSLFEMNVFDTVRKQGEYKFPAGVEKVV